MAVSGESFTFIADLVRRRSAILLAPGKEYLVEGRLLPIARERGLPDVDAYVNSLRNGAMETEFVRVVEAMTTNETSWFRDSGPFSALRSHAVPELIAARGKTAQLKIWSAACSTGQEPYSIAMTLADCLPSGAGVDILATDLSEQVLTKAREARYSPLEVNRGLPAAMLVRHLTRSGGDWQVSQELRGLVTFQAHNLLDAPPNGPFDVVFLRNVLIYFDLATKRAILDRVRRVMRADGILVLGAAETTIGVDDAWARVPVGAVSIYRPTRPVPVGSTVTPIVPQPRTASLSPVLTQGAHR
ncbi:protein-glutamate O-methyltransferase CheR [Cellulomonas sp. URHD0024]|uniref:CheR family methyltransferase n=1 Tax=Cellulomonas sp. URHD0024 TaxID=1302620 RepID=UPI0004213D14|nr:protein-glutamate O-methyltransferase CheR [Cellulomonas sp. URHD0024]